MRIRKVLISQPKPEDLKSSPYTPLAEAHGLEMDYEKLFKIEPLDGKEFRRQKIRVEEFTAIIFTSKNAVDYFFQQVKEARYTIPETMKYFCTSEVIALYLQNYITYRKRKIFFGKGTFSDLEDIIKKFKTEKFLIPCGDTSKNDVPPFMEKMGVEHKRVVVYKTVPRDLKNKIDIKKYDLLVFFSPMGIKSLFKNWPNYEQNKQIIATFGENTTKEATEHGLIVNIMAPTATAPSMAAAIDQFLIEQKKKKRSTSSSPKINNLSKEASDACQACGTAEANEPISDNNMPSHQPESGQHTAGSSTN